MEKPEERKAGYLVMRLKPGEGVLIADEIEIRIATPVGKTSDTQIAIRAPKHLAIRRVK